MTTTIGPELATSRDRITSAATATRTLTDTAQATLTAVPRIENPPSWYQPVATDLATAQSHAHTWLDQLCPLLSATPQAVVHLAQGCASELRDVSAVLDAIAQSQSAPTEEQRKSVDQALGAMAGALAEQFSSVGDLEARLAAHHRDLAADQDRLGDDLATIGRRFAQSGAWITQLQSSLGESFLDSSLLGPCTAIVSVDLSITMKITGVDADPTVVTAVVAKAVVDARTVALETAQAAIGDLQDSWASVGAKVGAVRRDLADAADADYLPLLAGIDLATAADQWSQLASFASTLVPSTH